MTARRYKRKKNKSFFKIFISALILFTMLGILVAYGYNLLNKIDNVEIPKDDWSLGIKDDVVEDRNVINIALFGLDANPNDEPSRSDSIMIASLDKVHKKIKLTSIMRDTYLYIPDHGNDKANHAYAFGGGELAVRTINQNFDMNIRDFVTIDFFGLEKIIDALGGIEVDVKANEVSYVNRGVRDANRLDDSYGSSISSSGPQILTGRQAVAYSRIRKTGDGDFERTERQRFVLEELIHMGLNAGITQYPNLLNTALPLVETSLDKKEILSLGSFVFTSGIDKVEKYRIPLNKYLIDERINGAAVLVPNTLQDNVDALKAFIYDDIREDINTYNND